MRKSKTEHQIKLIGLNANGEPAKFKKDVTCYRDLENKFRVANTSKGIKLQTAKGSYILPKHAALNIFSGVIQTTKVRVTLKKVVGTLSYWA